MSDVRQESTRKVVPVGRSDLSIDDGGGHTAAHWLPSEGMEAGRRAGRMVSGQRGVDEGAGEGQLQESHEDK